MTAVLALEVSTGTWLQYAVVSVAAHLITALPIMICTFALFYFVFGLLWGKCWNKAWALGVSPSRWALVGFAALTAAGSLTCADSLYGSNFFRTAVADELVNLPSGEEKENQDARQITVDEAPQSKIVVDGLCKMLHVGEDTEDTIMINQAFADAYTSALTLLWGLFCTSTLLLIGGVAFGAFSDIKEIKA